MTISNRRSRGVDGSPPARVLASTASSISAWKARRISVLQANSRRNSARLRSASRAISVSAMSLQFRSLARSSAALTALERLEKSSNMGATPSPQEHKRCWWPPEGSPMPLPLRERLGRQFARALGGGGDGAGEKVLDRVLGHEDLQR